MTAIPADKWKWFGSPAHFIGSDSCRFHLATEVGEYVISTVGDYYPHGLASGEPQEIGLNRKFETFVFRKAKGRCDCGCGLPIFTPSEIDSLPANDRATANKNHQTLCRKYAAL